MDAFPISAFKESSPMVYYRRYPDWRVRDIHEYHKKGSD